MHNLNPPFYLECQENTYGLRCNETCGHCLNGSSCSPVNGTCEFGCNAGYRNSLCKEGDFYIIFKQYFFFCIGKLQFILQDSFIIKFLFKKKR